MIKKIFTLLITFILLTVLFSCKNNKKSDSNTNTTTTALTDFPESVCNYEFNELNSENQVVPEATKQFVETKLASMTLEEKAGQMVQAERRSITPEEVKQYNVGSVLSGGGSYPESNTPRGWLDMYNEYQSAALESSSGIPIIYGVDAVHGHNNVYGATVFPHNIGLGAANDPTLMYKIGEATALEVKITGLDWNFSPAVSVAQDIRWGRIYESFGECPGLQASLTYEYVRGLQQHNISATAKHFIGDGGTKWNPDNYRDSSWALKNYDAFKLDQGDTEISMDELRRIHLQGYIEAINAGVDTVMVSYSSLNGKKMHGHELVQSLLKDELGFNGFVISDYDGIKQLPGDYNTQVITSINAGVDMLMEPNSWKDAITAIIDGYNKNKITMERINDAVGRILMIKHKRGLFESPIKTFDDTDFNSEEHKEIAREAVRKSLVLLKNQDNILPLQKSTDVLLLGPGADNTAIQSGGWTIEWQGTHDPNRVLGTSIYEGLNEVVSENGGHVYRNISDASKADVAIVVIAEVPYAEGIGDNGNLTLYSATSHAGNLLALSQAKQTGLPTIVILLSGRPMLINSYLNNWDAFIAAWLPGSEGGKGISDVIFGDYDFTGKLPVTWPKYTTQFGETVNKTNYVEEDYLFPYGFGLKYDD